MSAVEHRRRHRHTSLQGLAHLDDLILFERRHGSVLAVDGLEHVLERLRLARLVIRVECLADLVAKAAAGPSEMRLENLAHIHAARHAEWIENDVYGRAVLKVRHVLDGTIWLITPLLPWRPAILSPGWIFRFTATKTLTIFITPGGSSSPRCSFSTLSMNRFSRPL